MSPAQYRRLISTTCCDICGQAGTYGGNGRGSLHVDHDHDSGHIRGFLDPACNQMMGVAGEDTALIRLLAVYLRAGHGRLSAQIPSTPCNPGDCIVCSKQTDLDPRSVRGRRNSYCRQKCRLYANNILRTHGLTPGQYRFLIDEQSGSCLACAQPLELNTRTTVVDHNHANKQVRGLIHNACNLIIGLAEDSPLRLEAIVAYLHSPQSDTPRIALNRRIPSATRSNVPSTLIDTTWQLRFRALRTHLESFGKYPTSADADPAVRQLARWMWGLRNEHRNGRLQVFEMLQVESLDGWNWDPRIQRWETFFAESVETKRREGRLPVRQVQTETNQYEWLTRQRKQSRQGLLDPDRKKRLDASLPGWDQALPIGHRRPAYLTI